MFKNYFLVAWRGLRRNKLLTLTNIAGLALGMVCSLLTLLYVRHQVSFDRFHEKGDRIFRLRESDPRNTNNPIHSGTPAPLGPALQAECPDIESYVRVDDVQFFVSYGEMRFREYPVLLADSSFFEVFSFPLVRGNPDDVLRNPGSVVITEDIAKKYFGDEDPIGKILTFGLDPRFDFKVTGVAKNAPANSDLPFRLVVPFLQINELYSWKYLENWNAHNWSTYLLLREKSSALDVGQKIRDFFPRRDPQNTTSLLLQPLSSIHFENPAQVRYMIFFSAVAVIILFSCCINFTNLTVAQAPARAKEIGMRKVVGAMRPDILRRFLGESVFTALLALPLSAFLVQLLLPVLNRLTNSTIQIDYLRNWPTLVGFLGVAVLVGLLAGSYPAFYLASFRPVESLKGTVVRGTHRSALRNMLMVFQYAASIFLIIGTVVVYRQLEFMKNRDMGYSYKDVVSVPLYGQNLRKNVETIKNELRQNPNILDVAAAATSLPTSGTGNMSADWEGRLENQELYFSEISVDEDFFRTYGLLLVQGRAFSKETPSDVRRGYVLNETAVKALGWKEPLNKWFELRDRGVVIGVVKDFNFMPLQHAVRPLVLYSDPRFFGTLSVRVADKNIPATLDFIKRTLAVFDPQAPFDYTFLEDRHRRMYQVERKTGQMFSGFTLIAIVIATLGLQGISSLVLTQRTKEIGIRKVLGAPAAKIIAILSREFAIPIMIANGVAWPLAYWVMRRWLQGFPFRTGPSPWVFFLASALTLAIAMATISFKTVKAARANPVASLRYE
ncbi:MAG: ABC transporter permease [Candidatus Aminicenantes bacterium]|nr:ABC transporter permease [Candidatus Aminicenantes bacterium]